MGGQHLMNSSTGELPLCFQKGVDSLSHYCQLAKALGFQSFLLVFWDCEHSEGDDLLCCGVCWGTACLKCLVSLEAGKHLMKSHQIAGESDPCCRAEPNMQLTFMVQLHSSCQQLRGSKVFPGLESSM